MENLCVCDFWELFIFNMIYKIHKSDILSWTSEKKTG